MDLDKPDSETARRFFAEHGWHPETNREVYIEDRLHEWVSDADEPHDVARARVSLGRLYDGPRNNRA